MCVCVCVCEHLQVVTRPLEQPGINNCLPFKGLWLFNLCGCVCTLAGSVEAAGAG